MSDPIDHPRPHAAPPNRRAPAWPSSDVPREASAVVVRGGVRVTELRDPAEAATVRAMLVEARGPQQVPLVDESEDERLAAFAVAGEGAGDWDALVARRAAQVVGYAGVTLPQWPGGRAVADVAADRRDGADEVVRAALLAAAERAAWAAEAADLEVWIRDARGEDQEFARAHGYAVERRLGVLGRPLDDDDPVAPPAGMRIRALRPGDEDGVVEVLAAAYRGTAEEGWDRGRFDQRRAYDWFDPADLLVAVDGDGRVRGLHWLKRRSAEVGEVYNLAVHPDAQGTGLGGALLAAGLGHLRARGTTSVLLWVDLANQRAVRLYEAQGFVIRWEDLAVVRALCGPVEAAGGQAPPAVVARVFHGPGGPGNLTALLQVPGRPDAEQAQAIARRLGVPDTGLLWRSGPTDDLNLVTYSPHEELAFCTQTLLVAGAVIGQQPCTVHTASGPAEVTRDVAEPGRWWIEADAPAAEVLDAAGADLAPLGLAASALAGPPAVVGLGRRRLVLALADHAEFVAAAPTPAAVMEVCRARGWSAVCLAHGIDRDAVGLRVFTTSLAGAEDDATGGAALGLLAYRRAVTAVGEATFRVDQGDPGGRGGASMFVAPGGTGGRGRIGASVEVLVRGTLAAAG